MIACQQDAAIVVAMAQQAREDVWVIEAELSQAEAQYVWEQLDKGSN